MKLPNTLQTVRDLTRMEDGVMGTLDKVLDTVIGMIDDPADPITRKHTLLERGLFLQILQEWCERNPDSYARLLTIRPWDESSPEIDNYNFLEAIRREILPVIENQFDESVLLTQLDNRVFALFITDENCSMVENEFDWASKLHGLKTSLSNAVPLSFHLESALWPRDASTARTLLDSASPAETDITEIPVDPSRSGNLEGGLETVLEGDLKQQVKDKIPSTLRDKFPLKRFLN